MEAPREVLEEFHPHTPPPTRIVSGSRSRTYERSAIYASEMNMARTCPSCAGPSPAKRRRVKSYKSRTVERLDGHFVPGAGRHHVEALADAIGDAAQPPNRARAVPGEAGDRDRLVGVLVVAPGRLEHPTRSLGIPPGPSIPNDLAGAELQMTARRGEKRNPGAT